MDMGEAGGDDQPNAPGGCPTQPVSLTPPPKQVGILGLGVGEGKSGKKEQEWH